MQIPELQRGRALIITGPQGCGKSTIARELARRHGGYFDEIMSVELDTASGTTAALEPLAKVLIVEGLPNTETGQQNVKQLISSHTLSYRPAFAVDLVEVVPPLLIFTTNDTEQARAFAADGRRFDLLELKAETVTH